MDKTERERCSPRGSLIRPPHPSKGLSFNSSSTVTQCSTLFVLSVSSIRDRATGDKAFPSSEANPRRQAHPHYPSIPGASDSHEAPDLVSLFFFFPSCIASCRACLPCLAHCLPHRSGGDLSRSNSISAEQRVLLPSLAAQLDFRI